MQRNDFTLKNETRSEQSKELNTEGLLSVINGKLFKTSRELEMEFNGSRAPLCLEIVRLCIVPNLENRFHTILLKQKRNITFVST